MCDIVELLITVFMTIRIVFQIQYSRFILLRINYFIKPNVCVCVHGSEYTVAFINANLSYDKSGTRC